MANFAVIAVVGLIIGLACSYIHKERKRGVKCIGCPNGAACSGCCAGCSGSCCGSEKDSSGR